MTAPLFGGSSPSCEALLGLHADAYPDMRPCPHPVTPGRATGARRTDSEAGRALPAALAAAVVLLPVATALARLL